MFANVRRPFFITFNRLFSALTKDMDKHGVVPDVIEKAPEEILQVEYDNGVKVELGNELTPTQVKSPPTVSWNANPDTFYTLCMTDPDAPSRKDPEFREWHHWLVGNIPGNKVESGEILSAYIGSGPPPGTGLHRYVFLVYKQPAKIDFKVDRLTNTSSEKRALFSIRKFAFRHKLGHPIAANFYHAQWDDYVPILYKQLGE
ncbi:uncharacterized protein CBL_14391 [Carabus blaptoides fortunei]